MTIFVIWLGYKADLIFADPPFSISFRTDLTSTTGA